MRMGADPANDCRQAGDALGRVPFLVVQDLFLTDTASLAEVVLPAASFAESEGSAINLTGRLQAGEPIQAEALGIVFLVAGVAIWLEVSFLLAGMVAGVTIVNLARHHQRAFHEIEHIEWPFMILFFVLAGASFQLASFELIGVMGVAYIVLRTLARFAGGWIGGGLAGMTAEHRRWMGAALVPQAGVALGMALIAGDALPEIKEVLLTLVIGTTVVFEVAGPMMTLVALRAVGSDQRNRRVSGRARAARATARFSDSSSMPWSVRSPACRTKAMSLRALRWATAAFNSS